MRLKLIGYDELDVVKSNLAYWRLNFKQDSAAWLENEFGTGLFTDARRAEVPDFTLDMSAYDSPVTEAENVRRVYGNLRTLSDVDAADERLWAGLCLGVFWSYVKYRRDIDRKCTVQAIRQSFFFGKNPRRSLLRNALSRLSWIGRLTYDETRRDPWELTRFICEEQKYITYVLERNLSHNPAIIRPFLDAIIAAQAEGLPVDTRLVGALSKYLNLLGGTYILDCMPEERIYEKTLARARELCAHESVVQENLIGVVPV